MSTLLASRGTAETSPGPSHELPSALTAPLAVQTSNETDRHPLVPEGRTATTGAAGTRRNGCGRKSRKARRKKADYPRFFRAGETLVKLGWSRREKKTYEHKAPRSVVRALVRALHRAGAGGKVFTTEDLSPLKDPADRSEIPDYQAYLTLAWLRGSDLIVQHGRQGYSQPEGTDLSQEIDQLWKELPAR